MISESDQQLLDELLDGQLPAAEAQRLNRRLAVESELAGELFALRSARATRQSVFAAITPEPAAAEAFSRRVVSASRRQALRHRLAGPMRIGGGIAACIAMGFLAGWFGRGHAATPRLTTPVAVIHPDKKSAPDNSPAMPVTQISDNGHTGQQGGQLSDFQVTVTDHDGKVVASQKFESIEDANAFYDWVAKNAARGQPSADQYVYNGRF